MQQWVGGVINALISRIFYFKTPVCIVRSELSYWKTSWSNTNLNRQYGKYTMKMNHTVRCWKKNITEIFLSLFLIKISDDSSVFHCNDDSSMTCFHYFSKRKRQMTLFLVIFLFASGVNVVLTNIGKVTVGRPRPHFIATCFNQTSLQTFCTQPNQWITDYRCVGESSSIASERSDASDSRLVEWIF